MMMTRQDLASILNGLEYGKELSKPLQLEAKDNRLVAVFGASDDLVEFRGAIYDEVGAYEGAKIFVNTLGEIGKNGSIQIDAKWSPDEPDCSWLITTDDIEYSSFDIMEDGELFCRGMVFSMDAL